MEYDENDEFFREQFLVEGRKEHQGLVARDRPRDVTGEGNGALVEGDDREEEDQKDRMDHGHKVPLAEGEVHYSIDDNLDQGLAIFGACLHGDQRHHLHGGQHYCHLQQAR